jgi:hypothetical protein
MVFTSKLIIFMMFLGFSDMDLMKFRHTFLMRDPQTTIPLYHQATKANCGDFGEFNPNDGSFAELQTLMVSSLLTAVREELEIPSIPPQGIHKVSPT